MYMKHHDIDTIILPAVQKRVLRHREVLESQDLTQVL